MIKKTVLMLLCAFALVAGLPPIPPALAAQPADEDAVFYVGSIFLSLLHIPLKLATCATTQVFTSVAYVSTNGVPGNYEGGTNGREIGEVARGACTGPWVIGVDQVKGDYQ